MRTCNVLYSLCVASAILFLIDAQPLEEEWIEMEERPQIRPSLTPPTPQSTGHKVKRAANIMRSLFKIKSRAEAQKSVKTNAAVSKTIAHLQ